VFWRKDEERRERERRGEGETSGRMRGGKRFVLCVWFSFSRVQKSRQVEDERGGGLGPSLTAAVARGLRLLSNRLCSRLSQAWNAILPPFSYPSLPLSLPSSPSTAFLISSLLPTSQISSTAIAMVTDRRLQPLPSANFFQSTQSEQRHL